MKKNKAVPIFFILIFLLLASSSFAQNYLEIDLGKKEGKLASFYLGDLKIEGDFSFDLKKEKTLKGEQNAFSPLIFSLEGKNIHFGSKDIAWLKMRLIKRADTLRINYLQTPQIMVQGKIDLDTNQIRLDIQSNWQQESARWEGPAELKAKVWGNLNSPFASGTLNVANGRYKKRKFSSLFLNFFGKPPILDITDSKIILVDGSVYRVVGEINLKKFGSFIQGTKYVSQKVTLDGWQLNSENPGNVGLRKKVDEKFDVVLDARDQDAQYMDTGAELRYKVEEDQFLKLRMESNQTILGFEKRKEF